MAVRVTGLVSSPAAVAEADPWIPLKVSWPVERRGGGLSVYVHGVDGGYVELRSDEVSGALTGLVVVDAPPAGARSFEAGAPETADTAVILDAELWEWRVTPDYREPARRDTTVMADLSLTVADGHTTMWFGSAAVARFAVAGPVRVGLSAQDELICVSTPTPDVVDPGLNRLT